MVFHSYFKSLFPHSHFFELSIESCTYSKLFRNKRFMFDEMTRRGVMPQSLPYVIYVYENSMLLLPFFISCYFIFPLMNALSMST